ncbi:asparaginase [Cohnella silvisoli]|uniref:Asparaginase n=1 Tax=Cohnella silvisoli TaxID=2873699 RepID=A0ABV1L3Q5_9BACL|nr:asparaginase [Cohnella silvisoli]MCD9025988.1 asparaginase [Cohnella silvisoli]
METKEMPKDAPLVIMNRGGLVENVHRGRVCVVSAEDGKVIYSLGDVHAPAYVRSTAKPVQAMASLLDGAAEAYGFEDRHLALLAASHRGSREQMAALEEIVSLTGLDESLLAIQPGLPVGRQARDEYLSGGGKPRKLFHTCAGKHLGVLAWCKLKGWPLEGYIHADHPAQKEILRRIKLWADAEGEQVTVGKDGCGFPVAAMPLWRLGFIYGRLACPELAEDHEAAAAAIRITGAMNAFPEYVEGRNRLASLLLSDPNVVAKSGAHGVFALGLRKERLGVSIAVTDGTEIAWPYIAMSVLDRIGGGISDETNRRLQATFPTEFFNDAKEIAGRWEVELELQGRVAEEG